MDEREVTSHRKEEEERRREVGDPMEPHAIIFFWNGNNCENLVPIHSIIGD